MNKNIPSLQSLMYFDFFKKINHDSKNPFGYES